jgi:hypothetical protein
MAIKTSSQSLISRGSTTTAISGFGGGASSGASSTITSISYLAANGVALTANAAPTVSNSLIKIVGTGFTSGANVYLNGLLQPSANVTFVNSTELRLNMPPLTTNTYSLMTFDSTGAGAVYYPGVRFDPYAIFGNTSIAIINGRNDTSLTASGYGSGSITFSVAAGNTLPSGLSLAANGLLSGTTTQNTYSFYVNVTDSENQILTQQISLAVTDLVQTTLQYLVVAAGASGGSQAGGGGGAGGLLTGNTAPFDSGTTLTVTVGAGGAGQTGYEGATSSRRGLNGTNSSLIATGVSITSLGGGGGGSDGTDSQGYNAGRQGLTGGSGGGSARYPSDSYPYYGKDPDSKGLGTEGQGYNGGYGTASIGNAGGGGGGGGAGQAGNNNYPDATVWGANAYVYRGGGGGSGLQSSITGTATYYAGGGGGGIWWNNGVVGANGGTGGAGGGGYGSSYVGNGNIYEAAAGEQNTGGGGGGGSYPYYMSAYAGRTGAVPSGGSGVVILRTTSTASGTTGSPTVTTNAGYNVYKFTASGTITF